MPDISVNIEIWCSCGNGLCGLTSVYHKKYGPEGFVAEPCPKCLENARNEGHEIGYDEAKEIYEKE